MLQSIVWLEKKKKRRSIRSMFTAAFWLVFCEEWRCILLMCDVNKCCRKVELSRGWVFRALNVKAALCSDVVFCVMLRSSATNNTQRQNDVTSWKQLSWRNVNQRRLAITSYNFPRLLNDWRRLYKGSYHIFQHAFLTCCALNNSKHKKVMLAN